MSPKMTSKEKQVGWIYLLLYVFSLGTFLQILTAYIAPGGTETTRHTLYNGINAIVCMVVFRQFIRKTWSEFCDKMIRVFSAAILTFGVYVSINFAITFIAKENMAGFSDNSAAALLSESPLFAVLFVVVTAPIVEELLFRGVAFGTLYNKNKFLAYACTGLLFSFAHTGLQMFANVWQSVLYIVISMLLCAGYVLGHSIYCPILVHMGINALSLWMMAK